MIKEIVEIKESPWSKSCRSGRDWSYWGWRVAM